MKRRPRSEWELIERLTTVFAARGSRPSTVRLGIGDDAAVLAPFRHAHVWTVDTSVAGVHFDLRWLTAADVGARSFHAAVSDIAAMGARPVAALSSVIVPAGFDDEALLELVGGQAQASSELCCPVVGGNLSRGGELSVTTTVLGSVGRPITRAGARHGDEVWLVGDLGLAGAGLRCLERRLPSRRLSRAARRAVDVCIAAWRRPVARIREGRALAKRAHAAIDVSDGLGADAGHIAAQSRVQVVLEEARLLRVLRTELIVACDVLGESPLQLALGGGEDYALVATGPKGARPRGIRNIGRVERGSGAVLEGADGGRHDLGADGFDHFRHAR